MAMRPDSDMSRFGSIKKASGLYSRAELQDAKYSKFARFGTPLDPYTRLNATTEYLFFVKPDLHLFQDNGEELNSQLSSSAFFNSFIKRYDRVAQQLQYSCNMGKHQPFATLLSYGVNSNLDLPNIQASLMDNPSTIYGTSYEYRMDGESSNENHTFSLEFVDSKYLEIYMFFRAYEEYAKEKKYGNVTPPQQSYTTNKVLHNTMGIFKFLVADDMETIIHWSYYWGVIPTSVPRDVFSNSGFTDGLTFSVDFKAAFVDDMDPLTLSDFNALTSAMIQGKTDMAIYDTSTNMINGNFPSSAYIAQEDNPSSIDYNGKTKYKLKWR